MKNNIFISTGELSADIHAAKMVEQLRKKDPRVNIFANGGDNLKKAGAELLYHVNDISFMGFAEVIRHLPFIKKIFDNTVSYIEEKKIELVVLVDYPGFNLRLAQELKKREIPVIYYISPQIWAWHQSRIKIIKKCVQKVICILPFEPQWFLKHGVDAEYAGHPLMDKVISQDNTIVSGLSKQERFIGLFPGSRVQELERHMDIMMAAANKIRTHHQEMKFVVAMAPGRDFSAYRQKYDFPWLHWVEGENDAIMQQADYLIMVSGTASLEAALIKTPMVIIYRTSIFTYILAKLVAKVDYIGLANLIADREGIRELIQQEVTPENIFQEVNDYLTNPDKKAEIEAFYHEVSEKIGGPGASRRAAEIILEYLKNEV